MRFPDATQVSTVKTKAVMAPESGFPSRLSDDTTNDAEPQRTRLAERFKPLLGYLALFSITYSIVLAIPYIFLDDYPALSAAMHGNLSSEVQARLEGGRPVLAALFDLVFSFIHSLGEMRIARLVGIIALAVLAWLIYLALTRAHVDRRVALLIPILIGTLPTFQVYISWSIASIAVLSCVVSGLGLFAAEGACQRLLQWPHTQDAQARVRIALVALGYVLGAVLLLLTGLATAQTTGLYYWVFAGIYLLAADRRIPELLLRCAIYLLVAVIAMGLEFVIVEILARLSGSFYVRDALLTSADIPSKMQWFFDTALYGSLNLWVLTPRHSVAALVAVVILVGLFLFVRGEIWERLLKMGIALALVPLSYSANLVIAEDWASYRSQVVMSSLLALYLGLAVVGIVRAVVRQPLRAQSIVNALLTVTCALACVGAASAVALEFAVPSYVEMNLAVQELRAQSLSGKHEVYFIQPTWQQEAAPFVRYDEFGFPSSAAAWVPAPMAYIALSQVDPAEENLPVVIATVKPDGTVASAPPGSVVIDMRHLSDYNRMTLCVDGWGYCAS